MRFIYLILLLFIQLGLTSCATLPVSAAARNENISAENRTKTLAKIQSWNLAGLIAIHDGSNSGSANLVWQQRGPNYYIHAFGPLGMNAFQLQGTPSYSQLMMANGKKLSAPTPEAILKQETGWSLPVSNMYYWIRGMEAPNDFAQKRFDAYHHLMELRQSNWLIRYLNYTSVNNVDVPSKIFMSCPGLNVKIVISQWQISR